MKILFNRAVILCFVIVIIMGLCCAQNPPYKAVNLGAWLVVEGWMTPYLFDGIPNNDLLDGTQIQLKSPSLNMYVSAESGGGSAMVVNRTTASNWETFRLWRINQSSFNFRVNNDNFMGLTGSSDGKRVFSWATQPGFKETFVIERQNNSLRLRIRAPNGLYLQAINGDWLRADYGGNVSDWSDQNPWVFVMTIFSKLGGEYQLTNGYGPDRAPAVMRVRVLHTGRALVHGSCARTWSSSWMSS